MNRSSRVIILTAIALTALTGSIQGEDSCLKIGWSPGTLVVDRDTIPPSTEYVSLEQGRHRVSFLPAPEGVTWNPPLIAVGFDLAAGDTFSLDLDRMITVRIESEPPGGSLHRGKTWIGDTPLSISTLAGHADTLTLRRKGYLETKISPDGLEDGDTYRIRLLSTEVAGAEHGQPQSSGISTTRKAFKYGSLLGSVASISLGFWFKSRADAYYNDYLDHGNPDTIDVLYDKSISYDDRARTMFIIGESLAVVTAYLFLRDYFSTPGERQRTNGERVHYERY